MDNGHYTPSTEPSEERLNSGQLRDESDKSVDSDTALGNATSLFRHIQTQHEQISAQTAKLNEQSGELVRSLEQARIQMQHEHELMLNGNQQMSTECDALSTQNQTLLSDNESLTTRCSDLAKQTETLVSDCNDLTTKYEGLVDENSNLKGEISKLRCELAAERDQALAWQSNVLNLVSTGWKKNA